MAYPTVYEAMSTLRAVRRLKPDPIPTDVLGRVLQAAAWAPTGGNAQPWRIVLVTDPEPKQKLGELYAGSWKNFAKGYEARLAATARRPIARAKCARSRPPIISAITSAKRRRSPCSASTRSSWRSPTRSSTACRWSAAARSTPRCRT